MTKENATSGKLVAGMGMSTNGTGAHDHHITESQESDLLGELGALLENARVEPADAMTAAKVQPVIDLVATYQGIALQAGLEALTRLISHLPAEERQRLSLGRLLPKQADAAAFIWQPGQWATWERRPDGRAI